MQNQNVLRLPHRWLDHKWVEVVCSVRDSAGATTFKPNAVNEPDLFLWIKHTHYPQVTAKNYRNALRNMCRDQRPGYKESPLPEALRQLLKAAIKAIGHKRWGCQHGQSFDQPFKFTGDVLARLTGLSNASQHKTGEPKDEIGQNHDLFAGPTTPVNGTIDYDHASVASAVTQGTTGSSVHSKHTLDTHHEDYLANQHYAGGKHPISLSTTAPWEIQSIHDNFDLQKTSPSFPEPTAKRLVLEIVSETAFDDWKSDAGLTSNGARGSQDRALSGLRKGYAKAVYQPEFTVFDTRARNFDVDDVDADDDKNSESNTDTGCKFDDDIDLSLFDSIVEDELVQEMTEIQAKLKDVGLVSKSKYHDMEKHFTRCFSKPSEMAFGVTFLDRHEKWRPNEYANERAMEIAGVDFLAQQHFFDTAALVQFQEAMTQPRIEGRLTFVPRVWSTFRDKFGQPVKVLCDYWLPCITINGDEVVSIFAYADTVQLVRQPGVFVQL
jgi:hypothetical protein